MRRERDLSINPGGKVGAGRAPKGKSSGRWRQARATGLCGKLVVVQERRATEKKGRGVTLGLLQILFFFCCAGTCGSLSGVQLIC